MLWPVAVLAVPALLLGLVGVTEVEWGAAAVSVVLALLGAGVVLVSWRADPAADPARVLGPFRTACERAFAIDSLYAFLVVRPIGRLARGVVRTDGEVVDGAVRSSGHLAIGLSTLVRLAQRGNAQTYVTGALAGILLVTVGAVMLR
jgi:NADH-quinone oxidoreductase subunit L